MSPNKRFVVVIPGIMGSTLSYGNQPVWTDNIRENYNLLKNSSSQLQWTGQVAEAEMWKEVRLSMLLFSVMLPLWSETLDYLSKKKEYSIIECPYDWRQSLQDSCQTVFSHIAKTLNVDLKQESSNAALVVLTHSMGGLLFRVGFALGLIHPSHIERVVHMAPPLLGAPVAFRSLVEKTTLPLLNEYVRFMRFQNKLRFTNLMYKCFRTFPSMYELLPPKSIAFIHNRTFHWDSPFNQNQFSQQLMANAVKTHQLLNDAESLLARANVRVFTIFSEFNTRKTTDRGYLVETVGTDSYNILDKYPASLGDGTVLSDSARASLLSQQLPIHDIEHASMPNSKHAVKLLRSCGV